MAEPTEVKIVFDKADQMERIKQYLISGEVLHAVYDCKGAGTGFVGITDLRVIFYDQGVFSKKKSMISIPYYRVIGVASADDGVFFRTSEITILTAAGNFSFEFRGADKAHWVYSHIIKKLLPADSQLPA